MVLSRRGQQVMDMTLISLKMKKCIDNLDIKNSFLNKKNKFYQLGVFYFTINFILKSLQHYLANPIEKSINIWYYVWYLYLFRTRKVMES